MADQDQAERGPAPDATRPEVANHEPAAASASAPPFRPATVCLAAGLLAGLSAFALGELGYDFFQARRFATKLEYGGTVMVSTTASDRDAVVQNAALAFAGLGAMLGLCLGAAGGLVRRSAAGARLGGGLGLIVGGVVGAMLPYLTFPWYFRAMDQLEVDPMLIGLGLHAAVWGLIGGAAGLGFGLGLGEPRRILISIVLGVVGSVLGAVAFEILGGFFYPEALTEEPLAVVWQPRLMARLLVSVVAATAVGLSFPEADRPAAS